MKIKKFITVCVILGLSLMISNNALGYVFPAAYTWDFSTPNYNAAAMLHPGTIDTSLLIMGDFVGRTAIQPNAASYGDSGDTHPDLNWDDTYRMPVGNANTNGDALDGLWVQIFSDGGWWDLGSAWSTVAVMSSQDHGPYLGEGLEYRIYGTNTLWDNTSLSAQAPVTDVYLDGWRTHNPAEDANGNMWLSDDIAGVFNLGASYQYIKLVAWSPSGGYSEPEIDAVAGVVPVPGAVLLGILGLSVAGIKLRKFT